MAVSRDRVRDEDDVAVIIGYHERSVPGRLVLSGPEVFRSGPRPAGPQSTVYQGDRTPRGLFGLFGRGAEFPCRILDDRAQDSDVAGAGRLADPEYLGPYL